MEMLTEYLAKGFMVMLSISMPCVLTAAAIGLVVGIIQAVTQVQEQTIAAAPKIFAVFLVIVIGGMGFIKLLTNLIINTIYTHCFGFTCFQPYCLSIIGIAKTTNIVILPCI